MLVLKLKGLIAPVQSASPVKSRSADISKKVGSCECMDHRNGQFVYVAVTMNSLSVDDRISSQKVRSHLWWVAGARLHMAPGYSLHLPL
jgi:hypothetical protein